MNNQQLAENFRNFFEAACVELFQSLGCEITPADGEPFDKFDEPYTRIDAGCSDFELDIYLCLPYAALIMTYPIPNLHSTIPESELEDWLSELSNLLMGRLKRTLTSYNFNLIIGLPDFSIGHPPQLRRSTASTSFSLRFATESQIFEAGITVELLSDNVQLIEQNKIQPNVDDGDIEFF